MIWCLPGSALAAILNTEKALGTRLGRSDNHFLLNNPWCKMKYQANEKFMPTHLPIIAIPHHTSLMQAPRFSDNFKFWNQITINPFSAKPGTLELKGLTLSLQESNLESITVVVWPFKWKLLSSTFRWYCLFLTILQNGIQDFFVSFELCALGSERVKCVLYAYQYQGSSEASVALELCHYSLDSEM